MARIKLGLVGVGKIAHDQHLPVIALSEDFELVAVASRNARVDGVANFPTLAAMLQAKPEIEAVSLCTPPAVRAPDARLAIASGRHVMLEKPPASTLSEVASLKGLAQDARVSLYASWHSRHGAAVEPARQWLADKEMLSAQIIWKEDIRIWHPGQDWILDAGGLGVFDPGINALSIVTHIFPRTFALSAAELDFPQNRQAPVAARLVFHDESGAEIKADFDFLQTGVQTWDINVMTASGRLILSDGGAKLSINDVEQPLGAATRHAEYSGVYGRFANLVRTAQSDADITPLQHVADAYLLGRRHSAAPFLS